MLNFHKMFNALRIRPTRGYSWEPTADVLKICDSLDTLRRKHALIYVSFSGAAENAYQSIILDLDREQGCFEIDELFPVGFLLEVGHKIAVTVRHNAEQSLTFYSSVRERRSVNGSTSYILNLPVHVDGHQRRDAFRLETRGDVHWGVQGSWDSARVQDISISGIRLSVPEELGSEFQIGSDIESATINLRGMDVTTDLKVTRKSANDETGDLIVGARMTTLTPATRRKLEQFIMREQRHHRNRA